MTIGRTAAQRRENRGGSCDAPRETVFTAGRAIASHLIHDYRRTMDHPFIAALRRHSKLSDGAVSLLIDAMTDERVVAAGRNIAANGSQPDNVAIIVRGWACRYKVMRGGARQITALLLPGDICNDASIFGKPLGYGAGALTECRVSFISRSILSHLTENHEIANSLWSATIADHSLTNGWIYNVGQRSAVQRIASFICEIQTRLFRDDNEKPMQFACPISHEVIGDCLGITAVHVCRMIKELEVRGLLSFRKRIVVIHDLTGLLALAD